MPGNRGTVLVPCYFENVVTFLTHEICLSPVVFCDLIPFSEILYNGRLKVINSNEYTIHGKRFWRSRRRVLFHKTS